MFKKLFIYKCDDCGKKRQTFKESICNSKICMKCKRSKVPEEQMNIFDAIKDVSKDVNNVNKESKL